MVEVNDDKEQGIEPTPLRPCRHCAEEIKLAAKVCHHCSRVQAGFWRFTNFIRVAEGMMISVSAGLLAVAFLNLSSTREQLTQANQAVSKAEEALKRATATESRVRQAQCDIFDLAQSVIDIAEVIPRTDAGAAFAGGSLSQEDRTLLKTKTNSLRNKIDNFNKYEAGNCP